MRDDQLPEILEAPTGEKGFGAFCDSGVFDILIGGVLLFLSRSFTYSKGL